MQSTFLYMLAGLAAMSVGVDASAFSKASRSSIAIYNTTSPTTFSTAPASNSTGQVFACYPANEAIFTIVTSVVQSSFPAPTGSAVFSTFFPNATATGISAIPTGATNGTIFSTPTGSVVYSTFFPNATATGISAIPTGATNGTIFSTPTGSIVYSTFFPNATDTGISAVPTGTPY